LGTRLPARLWRQPALLSLMAAVAGPLLEAGRLGLHGHLPNGQWFIAQPQRLWAISRSVAVRHGQSLGPVGPVPEQTSLGDFWIPNRGLFAAGVAVFETFDQGRHRTALTAAGR